MLSVSRIGVYTGVIALNIMMFLVVVDVFLRKFFAAPIRGSLELTEILLGIVVFLGLAYCAAKDEHVVIDIIVDRLPRRLKKTIMSFIYFLSVAVSALMAWRLFVQALSLQAGHHVSMMLGLVLYPFLIIAFIGCALMTLVYIMNLIAFFIKDKE